MDKIKIGIYGYGNLGKGVETFLQFFVVFSISL